MNFNQKGVLALPILFASIAVIVFLVTVSIAPFNSDSIFQALNRKPESQAAGTYSKKVLLLIYMPIIEFDGNKKEPLTEYMGWSAPVNLTNQVINGIKVGSGGSVNYSIAETVVLDQIPVKADGFAYTDQTYLDCVNSRGANCHNPDGADYNKMIKSVKACQKLETGQIDELWIWGGPWFGFWESTLTGPGAYGFNGGPVFSECEKLLPVMGFNYERGAAEALHSYGHRIEATMTKTYHSWQQNRTSTNFDKFGLNQLQSPSFSVAGCGSIHYPPNAQGEYDYSSQISVNSYCDDFKNYPNLGDINQTATPISCGTWGCNQEGYLVWWMSHIPKGTGTGPDGRLNDWWSYIVNPASAIISTPPIPVPSPSPSQTPTPIPTPSPSANSKFITLTYPNGGETLKVGDTVRITWNHNRINNCWIGYSFGVGSLSWVATNINPSSGYYDWVVNVGNVVLPKNVKIRLLCSEIFLGDTVDESDNFFTVNH